jgi:hypothetical protein
MSGAAYRDRGFGGAAEMDRKRIKEALEKPSPSTSRGVSREKELLAASKITTSIGKVPKVSDGGEDLARFAQLCLLVFCTALPALATGPGLCCFILGVKIIYCAVIAYFWGATCTFVCSEMQDTGIPALPGAEELVTFSLM